MNHKEDPLILTIDFGTQSVRASIFDKKGNALASEKQVYTPAYFSPKPGWAEQEPGHYFACLCEATKRLVATHPDLLPRIKGITQTCFRDSAVLLDKNNEVIRPMILWLDQRSAKCEKKLPLKSRLIFGLVGKTETIRLNRVRTAANWIKENEPENWAKCAKYVSVSTYFLYRLTGCLKDSASSFTGHYPIDYKKKAWYKDPEKHFQGMIFGVRKDQLCELVPPRSEIGKITKEASDWTGLPEGIPVFASGSDKSCETLGSGVIDPSLASISLGTACTVETTTKKYAAPFPFLPAYPSVTPDAYNLDLQIYRGFWTINWFLKEFAANDIRDLMSEDTDPTYFNEHLKDVPPGSDGLILQPFWGSELEKPEVRGSIIGFSDMTTREHVYRALIEGVAYELRMGTEQFEKKVGRGFDALRISGGGSKSDEICQIMANVLHRRVERIQTNEASSLGAAIVGFMSLGEFKDEKEAVDEMVALTKTFLPREEEAAVYDKLYRDVYLKLYPNLKKQYKYLYHFSQRK